MNSTEHNTLSLTHTTLCLTDEVQHSYQQLQTQLTQRHRNIKLGHEVKLKSTLLGSACHLKMRSDRKIDRLTQDRRSMAIDYYSHPTKCL